MGAALVGREVELERLSSALVRVAEGGSWTLAIVGEAGIGKTSLLDALCSLARERGTDVLTAQAAHHERGVPLAVVAEALDDPVGRRVEDLTRGLDSAAASELAAVLPALAPAAPQVVGPSEERYRLHFALRGVLERLAAGAPLVLALDDVHWADDASTEFLGHLLRRPPRAPVLLAVAYRARSVAAELAMGIHGAQRRGQAEVLKLTPLSLEEAGELIGPELDVRQRQALYRESGGNPFYLQQLARSARHQRIPGEHAGDTGGGLPDAVRIAVTQEFERLSQAAVRLARGASVVGEPFDLDLAVEVAQLDEADALAALDELVDTEIIRHTDAPRRFAFRHPIVCRAAYGSAGAGWRLAAHRRALAALERQGAGALTLAPHAQASGSIGDTRAVEILHAAGDTAAPRAPGTATRWYRAALNCVGEVPALAPVRLRLLLALASALGAEGRLHESRDCLTQALDAVPAEQWQLRNDVLGHLAFLKGNLGEPTAARELLLDALAEVAPEATAERATLLLTVAVEDWHAGAWTESLNHAAAGARLARQINNAALLGSFHAVVALVESWRGGVQSGETNLAAAMDLLGRADDQALIAHWDGLCYLVLALWGYGHCGATFRQAQRGLRLTHANGRGELFSSLVVHQAMAELALGQVDQAAQHAEEALEAAMLAPHSVALAWALTAHGWVALERGDLELARQQCERAIKTSRPLPRTFTCTFAPLVLAEARLALGEPRRARDELAAQLADLHATERTWALRLLVEAEIALGRRDPATSWLAQAQDAAEGTGNGLLLAHATWAAATVALAEQRPEDAATLALAAADHLERDERRLDASKAAVLAMHALHADGQRQEATDRLKQLRAQAVRWGAWRVAASAQAPGRHEADGPGLAGSRSGRPRLTARELEIVERIAKGHTNKQIAEQLFLSVRTVESHVARILDKLGVRSRAAVAAAVVHHDTQLPAGTRQGDASLAPHDDR